MSELFNIVAEFGFTTHAYVDDTQLYISVPAVSYHKATERFALCLERVRDWMASNRIINSATATTATAIGTYRKLIHVSHVSLHC